MDSKEITEAIDIGAASNESNITPMRISDESIDQIKRYLDANVTMFEGKIEENVAGDYVHMPFRFGDTSRRLRLTVPPHVQNAAYNGVRQSLPIYDFRDHILDVINNQ